MNDELMRMPPSHEKAVVGLQPQHIKVNSNAAATEFAQAEEAAAAAG